MNLSVVIPAYNEKDRIGPTLKELSTFLGGLEDSTEVVVVDDGSADGTAEYAATFVDHFETLRVIGGPVNRGKGHAIRTGMVAARGELRLFADADGSTPWDEYVPLRSAMAGADIAIASIGMKESRVERYQPGLRTQFGRAANLLIQALVLPGIRDSQRGFKLFTADAADLVFSRCVIDGWAFDIEALGIARQHGLAVAEVPVRWEHREDSRVTSSSYLQSLVDLMKIRARLWTGFYR